MDVIDLIPLILFLIFIAIIAWVGYNHMRPKCPHCGGRKAVVVDASASLKEKYVPKAGRKKRVLFGDIRAYQTMVTYNCRKCGKTFEKRKTGQYEVAGGKLTVPD